ncbi:MAG TPA: ABC transporter substrate-binding protein [Bryobacteraceae bacterium]|nr:ABC transporter substrate-binding protein [Bryobacteraceae bacterium]
MSSSNLILAWILILAAFPAAGQWGGQLRLALRNDPRTFDPLLVDDSAGETIRYLTGGVLVRLNRVTQKLEPELAKIWKISNGGRRLTLDLRENIVFSDGTPFTADDVAFTIRRMMDPSLHSPTGDSFRSSAGSVSVSIPKRNSVVIDFPAPVASLERLLDQVVIQSAKAPQERAVLGPFRIADHRPGQFVELRRNPNYWKKNSNGRRLPYLDSVRLDILGNKDTEMLRFSRGELHIMEGLDADSYDRLRNKQGITALNAGATTDVEMFWFNQAGKAPINAAKRSWFQSRQFRQAVSLAINREDMIRLVYRGYAKQASGPVPSSSVWFNRKLQRTRYNSQQALRLLNSAGFQLRDSRLYDKQGNAVAFSLITNAGNKTRLRLASLIQDDLKKIGIDVNITTLDFPSLLERTGKTLDYDACLLGLVNVDPDPNAQMNVWLSSAVNHQWNPAQKVPATEWEAEIDKLMRVQASAATHQIRKQAFDRVQEIVAQESPFIYLVNRDALGALTPALRNISPASLRPHFYWNIEHLSLNAGEKGTHVAAATVR